MHTSLLQFRAHHMATKIVAMICGQQEGHLCCVDNAYSTSMAEASEGDSCRRVTPSYCQVVCPRHWSQVAGIGVSSSVEKSLDWIAFALVFLGFFLLIYRTAFLSLFFQGLVCKIYPPLDN
jgi:hypothetical protein